MLWAAALSSIIGASYTSATFLVSNAPERRRLQNWVTIGFICISSALFMALGTAPKQLLVFAGAFNGLVLPIGLTLVVYVAAFRRKDLLHGYKYPAWLLGIGVLSTLIAWWLAWTSFASVFQMLSA